MLGILSFNNSIFFYIMKLNMILVFALVVGAVAIPYIFFVSSASNAKKLSNFFKAQAAKQGLSFNLKEQWSNRIIGIDTSKNVLLYTQFIQGEFKHQQLDLNAVARVHILEDLQSKRIEGKLSSTLENLALELVLKGNEASIILNFYDSLLDASQNFEMKRANSWKTTIEDLLKQNEKATHVRAA